MGYDSLSAIALMVLVAAVLALWLPRRTVIGMKRVQEHRQDRYSSTLHLIDASSGTRFNDVVTPRSEGALMQTNAQVPQLDTEKIAHIRAQRRAAVKRRQIIVAVLLLSAIVVAVLAYVLQFNMAYTIIPVVLLVVVLALGARTAAHARAWEANIAKMQSQAMQHVAQHTTQHTSQVTPRPKAATPEVEKSRPHVDASQEAPTDVMEQREIRRALREAELSKQRALAERAGTTGAVKEGAATSSADVVESTVVDSSSVEDSVPPAQATTPEIGSETPQMVDSQQTPSLTISDATAELQEVHSSGAMDAFSMATSQDLISFSLGEVREDFETTVTGPESLEIKSTKQVAKAVPVEETTAVEAVSEADSANITDATNTENPSDSTDADEKSEEVVENSDARESDSQSFHDSEIHAQVDAPDATSDSLGTGLEAILARRGA